MFHQKVGSTIKSPLPYYTNGFLDKTKKQVHMASGAGPAATSEEQQFFGARKDHHSFSAFLATFIVNGLTPSHGT